MSAVLDDPAIINRMVPLSGAVAINPKLDRASLTDDTLVSFVPMAAVGAANGQIDVRTTRPYAEVKKGYTYFRDADVLFAKVTPCMENGKMAVARNLCNGVGFGSTEFHVLRPHEGVDPQYIYHFVSSSTFRKEAARHMTGAVGLRRVPTSFLQDALIPLPELDEQQRIVAEIEKQFSRLDEAVANLQRVKANLKRYKAAVLKAAVEGRLVETEAELARRNGHGYESGQELLLRIQEDALSGRDGRGKSKLPVAPETENLNDVPEGWVWASVDQLAAPGSRSITDGPFGSNLKSAHYVEFGPRVIRLQNIKDGEFEDAYAHITQEHFESLRKHEIFAGDLVIASLGENPPRACIVPSTVGPAIVKADCIRFKPHSDVSAGYLNAALNAQPTRTRLKDAIHGIGRPRLSLGEIRAIALPIPPAAEQVRIVAEVDRRLSIVREIEAEVDANLQRVQSLKSSVLSRAFSGEGAARVSTVQEEDVVHLPIGDHSIRFESAPVVMAAKVLDALAGEPTMGRVKLQKIVFLAAYHGKVESANAKYVRMQAGPLDMPMLEGVIKRLNDLGWFRETARNGKSNQVAYSYAPLTKAGEHKKHLVALTAEQIGVIDQLVRLMRTWNTEQCELLATVYGAWNDLLIWKRPPTVDAIAHEALENWHEAKRKFSRQKISQMIEEIKRLGIEPSGFGLPTKGSVPDLVSKSLFES